MNLQNQIKDYFKDRPEITAVYLFGSHAKECERLGSDIDLGILLGDKYAFREDEFHNKYLLGLSKLLRMDIHLVSMKNAGEGILLQIFKYGKCLVNNAPDELIKYKMTRYTMIADFKYSQDIMKKGFFRDLFEQNR